VTKLMYGVGATDTINAAAFTSLSFGSYP
jgi:hypothetical protein